MRTYTVNLLHKYMIYVALIAMSLSAALKANAHSYALGDEIWLDEFSGDSSVVTGDFNGDGRDDMMFCFGNMRIIVRTQQSDGTMLTTQDIPIWSPFAPDYPYATYCRRMEVFDFNMDGKSDVVIMHSQGITTLLSTSSDFARTEIEIPYAGYDAAIVSSALLDTNDGSPDLVGVSRDGHFSRWKSTIPGSWQRESILLRAQGREHMSMRAGDLNSDGLTDFVVVSSDISTSANLEVFLNTGNGTFSPSQVFDFPQGTELLNVEIGDMNNDDRSDVVVTNSRNVPASVLLIFRQLPTGVLATYDTYGVYEIPFAIAISDMDGDGRNDLVLNHWGWDVVTTYLQKATGLEFEAYVGPFANVQNFVQPLAIGDFDFDGCKDIVATVSGGYRLIRGLDCALMDDIFISGFD